MRAHLCPHAFLSCLLAVAAPPGISNAVGLALAQANLAAKFNEDGFTVSDNFTYVICGDGCLQEGVSSEACSLAGHLGLGKLIVLYDDNKITIDGDDTTTDDVAFSYNGDSRLDGIEGEGFDVDIDYDDNGRVAAYDGNDEDGAFEAEYTYEDGNVSGLQFTPLHAYGDLFDMGGQAFGTPNNLSRAVVIVGF